MISRIGFVIVIELLLVFIHLVLYTESVKTGVSDLSENPAIRLIFHGDLGGVDGGLQMFMALVFGFATPIAAISFFFFLEHLDHKGLKFSDIPNSRSLFMGAMITVGTYAISIFYELSLVFQRLINTETVQQQAGAFFEALGIAADSTATASGINPATSLVATLFMLLINALLGWICARIIHTYQITEGEEAVAAIIKGKRK